MAFLNDLGKKLGEVAGDAADKAKDVAEFAKVKAEIAVQQKKLQQGYIELGKLYFEQVKDAEDGPGFESCSGIKASLSTIAELEAKIANGKNE
jgi:hypothetical protein